MFRAGIYTCNSGSRFSKFVTSIVGLLLNEKPTNNYNITILTRNMVWCTEIDVKCGDASSFVFEMNPC